MVTTYNSSFPPPTQEAVFFPFDDHSIPLRNGLQLGLVSGMGRRHPVVLRSDPDRPDAPDGVQVREGSVALVDGRLRIWYGGYDGERYRTCYATSSDGLRWERPDLGYVEYRGSRNNNLVDIPVNRGPGGGGVVIHDPRDADPERRFKMAFVASGPEYQGRLSIAFSADGLRWREHPNNPVGPFIELTGLVRRGDCYFLNGQCPPGTTWISGRTMQTYVSYDFEEWSAAAVMSFQRHDQVFYPPEIHRLSPGHHSGEQVHTGAGIWDRENVLVGFYDQWHGPANDDRRFVDMDIGLVVSNDGLHFREPIADFRIIAAYESPEMEGVPVHHGRAVTMGQGFANVDDRTCVWYGAWGGGGPHGVRLATWPRDRLGYLEIIPRYDGVHGTWVPPQFVTAPVSITSAASLFVNADRLSHEACLKVQLCDEALRPIPEYSGADAATLTQSGLRLPIRWRGKTLVDPSVGRFRVRVDFEGYKREREDARFYALYITTEE